MLVDEFMKFLEKIECSYWDGVIPDKNGITEIGINGSIPKDKLEEFLKESREVPRGSVTFEKR